MSSLKKNRIQGGANAKPEPAAVVSLEGIPQTSSLEAESDRRVRCLGEKATAQHQMLVKRAREAEADFLAMRVWAAKASLAAARQQLNTVTAELVALPERPEFSSLRHWLTAQKDALLSRLGL